MAIDNLENPQAIRVYLRHSKTDQFGRGSVVIMGRTDDLLCPVAAVAAFMRVRHLAGALLHDGTALTKAKFVQITRQPLKDLGLQKEQFAGHSFRIGSAKAAAQAGLEDSCIMMLGKWNSAAFRRYIRTTKTELASATARLSRCSSSA